MCVCVCRYTLGLSNGVAGVPSVTERHVKSSEGCERAVSKQRCCRKGARERQRGKLARRETGRKSGTAQLDDSSYHTIHVSKMQLASVQSDMVAAVFKREPINTNQKSNQTWGCMWCTLNTLGCTSWRGVLNGARTVCLD